MDTVYSTQKLIPPFRQLRGAITRREIRRWHSAVESSAVVSVQAPAGYGKTTAVLQLLDDRRDSLRWISVSRSVADRRSFWLGMVGLFARDIPTRIEALRMQFATGAEALDAPVIAFCNALGENRSGFELVVDDFHQLGGSVDSDFELFLDNIPRSMRVWIVSRDHSSLLLSRYAMSNDLFELGPRELAFESDDAAALLTSLNPGLTREQSDAINRHVGGWPAGVRTIGMLVGDAGDPSLLLRNLLGRNTRLADDLARELLGSLDETLRKFVIRTSFLKPLSVSSACIVCEEQEELSCRRSLRQLEGRGVFLNQVDEDGDWYEYHGFFQELIQRYVVNSSDDYAAIVRLSVDAQQSEGRPIAAALLASENGLYDTLSAILISDNAVWFDSGRFLEFLTLAERIPAKLRRTRPPLNGLWTWARTVVRQDVLPTEFEFDTADVESGESGLVAAAAAYSEFYIRGSFDRFMSSYGDATKLLGDRFPGVSSIVSFIKVGALQWNGDPESAYQELRSQDREGLYRYSAYVGVLLDTNLGFLLCDLLRPGEAAALYADTRRRLEEKYGDSDQPVWGLGRINDIRIRSWNDVDSALLHETNQAIQLAEQRGVNEIIFMAHLYAAEIAAAFSFEDATYHIDRALHFVGKSNWGRIIILAEAVRLACWHGAPEDSKRWAYQMESVDSQGDLGEAYPALAACWLAWHQGDAETCVAKIDALRQESSMTPLQALEADLLKARAGRNETEQSRLLERCGELGLAQWARVRTGSVLARPEQRPPKPAEVDPATIAALSDDQIRAMVDREVNIHIHGFEEHFNGRELQILHLMSQGASNSEIADTIFISVNTVRWYARQLFAKLDVRRRGEATAAARELGLLAV